MNKKKCPYCKKGYGNTVCEYCHAEIPIDKPSKAKTKKNTKNDNSKEE